ncbi:chromophore lyase CpcT/CpeT [bacterium]|nr:chromophore lyase CpcT/CpeT [bacterium]
MTAARIQLVLIVSLLILFTACQPDNESRTDEAKPPATQFLADASTMYQDFVHAWTGSFVSDASHSSQPGRWLETRRIMPDSTNGYYLYTEEGIAGDGEHDPVTTRQRVYRFVQPDDTTLWASVFVFRQPVRFAGAWNHPARLATIELDSLIYLRGCHLSFKQTGADRFEGQSIGDTCPCDSNSEADYLASRFVLTPTSLLRMDSEKLRVGGAALSTQSYTYLRKDSDFASR